MFSDVTAFKRSYEEKISSMFAKSLEGASLLDKYVALASMIRDAINQRWVATNNTYLTKGEREVYYFSLEFLVGKFLENNLLYLGAQDVCRRGLGELGIDLDELFEVEPDAGLGNGGLGRLAACFLDSIASMALPGHGCGIRYKYGLFAQKIVNGYQVELPDNWLRDTNAWEIHKPDKAVVVRFGGRIETSTVEAGNQHFKHVDSIPVLAVPYDMPILGYHNNTVSTLRLWSAEAIDKFFDFPSFSRGDYVSAISNRYAVEAISEVLYPDDSNYQNRQLRLKQQYFFVSAGLQSIIRRYKKKLTNINNLSEYVVVHINDTHPALAVPELMRILIDEEGLGWDEAWAQTTKIIAYTNHTIMPEALETWPIDIFRELLPRITMIVEEINARFCDHLNKTYPNDPERVRRMAILSDGVVKMANLAVVGSFSVNGVAAVHSELLKTVVMRELCEYFPEKFGNKTNGVTHRRWLIKANPHLTKLLEDTIGPYWIHKPERLQYLEQYKDDAGVLESLYKIKRLNKERLAAFILKSNDIVVDPDSIFDVQVKRIHAYKRQLLNALHVLYLYNELCENPGLDITPRTFVIAGKAAPSYYYAKNVIKLINEIAYVVNNDPQIKGKIKLVFLENYGVQMAEYIFPASDVSEQISTASKEASGTGNMKFMMNGAVTIGTDDGANIEIRQMVGDNNFFLFGLSVKEVLDYYANGGYNSIAWMESDPRLKRLMGQLQGGFFARLPHDEFVSIVRSLLDYNDEYFVMRDFDSYVEAQRKVDTAYRDRKGWQGMALQNIAYGGRFSSDYTISQYAREIWGISPSHPKQLKL